MKGFAVWLDDTGERWDLKGAQAAIFKAAHPHFVPLGNFVEERVELVRPSLDPDKEWPVYGVSNKVGVFLSHMQLGEKFRTPYKRIEKDWFFHNPTRANVGSLGRVPIVPEDAVTSPEYQVWSIKNPEWMPEYVEALISMPFFNLLIQVHRVGAVKERLYARNLMEIPVPNHGRDFQKRIVQKWTDLRDRIAAAEKRIEEHEESLVAQVLADSGIEVSHSRKRPKAYALQLDEIERWGVGFNRYTWSLEDMLQSSMYDRAPIESVAFINPKRTKTIPNETRVTFVPMEAVSETSGAIESAEDVPFDEVSKGYTAFEEGDVIWAKITPCMENGKSAVARNLVGGVGFGSTEFHVVRPRDPDAVIPEYLWCLLRLKAVRQAARRYFIGSAGQQRVPDGFLKDLVIPVPPKTVQESIVEGVRQKRLMVSEEYAGLAKLRKGGLAEIEQAIVSGHWV